MREGSFFDAAIRYWRETTGEKVFYYDPTFTTHKITKGENTAETPWRENPDGSITIGKEQIRSAIITARAFNDKGPKIAESTATVIGLSLAYIKEHFPEALEDVGYRE